MSTRYYTEQPRAQRERKGSKDETGAWRYKHEVKEQKESWGKRKKEGKREGGIDFS